MAITTRGSFSFLVKLGRILFVFPLECRQFTIVKPIHTFSMIVSVVLALLSALQVVLCFYYLTQQVDKFASSTEFVYVTTVFVYRVFFLRISMKWRDFLKPWAEIDLMMSNYPVLEKYHRKMKLIAFVFIFFAVGEHIFFMFSKGLYNLDQNFVENLDSYFQAIFNLIFFIIPYNRCLGCILQVLNWFSTLTWTFADIYLVVVTIPLTFRLRQIHKKLKFLIKHQIKDENQWQNIREHFFQVTQICEHTENYMTHVLTVSFCNKLYVVLYQLLGFIREHQTKLYYFYDPNFFSRLYFGVSFAIILCRLVTVTWFSASIDSESQDIAKSLFSVPSDIYNTEVERFVLNITVSPPILSGFKMFHMTKSLILKIATSIIVYELVLIKFQTKVNI